MRFQFAVAAALALALAGCATALPPGTEGDEPLLLLGEQHDAPTHAQAQRSVVEALAHRGRLAAVVLEMAEQGASTSGLPRDATPQQVQLALRWREESWPWARYGPAVMAAVRSGAPVLGGNLPRERMRPAMGDTQLDAALPEGAWRSQQAAIREGHCGLLPETQIVPMARIQGARDRAMAATLMAAAVPGKTAVLLAGAGHVDSALGIPRHLPAGVSARAVPLPSAPTGKDYCEELRRQMAPQR